jgi:porphobilinogen synthase
MIHKSFPHTRLRRPRMQSFSRALMCENKLLSTDLIWPVFIHDGSKAKIAIESMPGVYRFSQNEALKEMEIAYLLGITAVALFPVVDDSKRTDNAKEAWNPKGLIQSFVAKAKKELPDLGIITDVALDPYTSHGQDGLLNENGDIENDATIDALCKQALSHAHAGADIVAPSDMMDGRIGKIRNALEQNGHNNTMILAYSAKYASSYYGPFRDAVGSKSRLGKSNKKTYQMDPANSKEAMREIALDISEGADFIMVKPGLPYLDIVHKAATRFDCPVFAYNVSGEYAMVKAASAKGWIDERSIVLESLLSFKRAGAQAILTYHAIDAARWLQEE